MTQPCNTASFFFSIEADDPMRSQKEWNLDRVQVRFKGSDETIVFCLRENNSKWLSIQNGNIGFEVSIKKARSLALNAVFNLANKCTKEKSRIFSFYPIRIVNISSLQKIEKNQCYQVRICALKSIQFFAEFIVVEKGKTLKEIRLVPQLPDKNSFQSPYTTCQRSNFVKSSGKSGQLANAKLGNIKYTENSDQFSVEDLEKQLKEAKKELVTLKLQIFIKKSKCTKSLIQFQLRGLFQKRKKLNEIIRKTNVILKENESQKI